MYSEKHALQAVEFFHNLKHTKGKWHGVPFDLIDWQDKIIRDVYGTLKPDGYRQYRFVYCEIPKKQGKSELAAGIALKQTCADGEWGAEIYGCAADRSQASFVFDVAVDMVDQWPALKKRCKPVMSKKRLIYKPTNSFYQVLSAEAYTKHGLNPHGVIFDELHAQPNRELYDVMTMGSGDARTQPLFFIITTAGDDPDRLSIGWQVHDKATRILRGEIDDPRWYCVIYGLDEDDDPDDPENWKKANPSIGHTVPLETVREAWQAAKGSSDPDEWRKFCQLRLNIWVRNKAGGKWIKLTEWDDSAKRSNEPILGVETLRKELQGRECFGGLDLSSKFDLTSFCLLFTPTDDDPHWYTLAWSWIPEDNMKERVKTDKVPYDRWVREGHIMTTPGNVIDYDFIEAKILELRDLYDIQEIGFDPWNATQTALHLAERGLTMVEVRQGAKTMNLPMKDLHVLVRQQNLIHAGDPVLRWAVGNVETKADENDNIRPVKNSKTLRIDPAVAMINAMARAMLNIDNTSVYETRGVLSV